MKKIIHLCTVLAAFAVTSSHAADKTFIDYFQPTPIVGGQFQPTWESLDRKSVV